LDLSSKFGFFRCDRPERWSGKDGCNGEGYPIPLAEAGGDERWLLEIFALVWTTLCEEARHCETKFVKPEEIVLGKRV